MTSSEDAGKLSATQNLSGRDIAGLALSVALVPLNSTMLAVAIPAIARDVHTAEESVTAWLVTSYLVTGIVLQSPGGKLGDLLGHARALRVGQLVFAVGCLSGYFGKSLIMLVVARALMAAGGAVMGPAALAAVRSSLREAQRPKAFGAFGALMGLSAALGPLLGGEVASRFGWPWLFALNGPPLIASFLLATRGVTKAPSRGASRIDIVGSILLGVSLACLVAAPRAHRGIMIAIAGVAVLGALIVWERRTPDPIVDLRLFALRRFTLGGLGIALQNLAMYAVLFELPILLGRLFSANARTSGRTLLAMTLAMVCGAMLGGRSASRFGARAIATLGSAIAVGGMVLLATTAPNTASDTVLPLSILGAGIGLTTPSLQAASLGAVSRAQSGMAAGVSSTMRYLGGVLGVAVVSRILTLPDAHESLRTSAWIFAGALTLALGCAVCLGKQPHDVSD